MMPTLHRLLRDWRSVALGVAGIGLTIAVFWASRNYPNIPWAAGGPPGDYPRALAVALGVLSLLVLGQALRGALRGCPPTGPTSHIPVASMVRIAAAVVLLLVSPLLLHRLGFLATGMIVCFVTMLCAAQWSQLRLRTVAWMAVVAVCAVFVLKFAFEDFAGKRLPKGTWLSGEIEIQTYGISVRT